MAPDSPLRNGLAFEARRQSVVQPGEDHAADQAVEESPSEADQAALGRQFVAAVDMAQDESFHPPVARQRCLRARLSAQNGHLGRSSSLLTP